jgi:hypothetical protein
MLNSSNDESTTNQSMWPEVPGKYKKQRSRTDFLNNRRPDQPISLQESRASSTLTCENSVKGPEIDHIKENECKIS